jgi:hypothetical protein
MGAPLSGIRACVCPLLSVQAGLPAHSPRGVNAPARSQLLGVGFSEESGP